MKFYHKVWQAKFKRNNIPFYFCAVLFAILCICGSVSAVYSKVIAFGADLSTAQKSLLASDFGVNLAQTDIPVIDVTNAEERKFLEGLVPEHVLGTKAISSAIVEILPAGGGVSVKTRNITWVTDNMYSNALVTAGVKDARVIIAAPFPVSGTAALTGIFKAVEHATGKSLGDRPKKVANEELVGIGNLGEEIGKDQAAQLILLIKEQVVKEGTKDPERIRQIVIKVAGDLNIRLSDKQIEQVTALMLKISTLNLNLKDIMGQLRELRSEVEKAVTSSPEMKGWLQRVLDTLNRLVEHVRALILGVL